MGADIHDFAEVREGGVWCKVGKVFPSYWYERGIDTEEDKKFSEHPFEVRNYRTFGILAGVRWEETHRIAEPKGFPEDASDEVKLEYSCWGINAHTPSWLTLTEMINFDWRKGAWYDGTAALESFKHWLDYGVPTETFYARTGGNCKNTTIEHMKRLAKGEDPQGFDWQCPITWFEKYTKTCDRLLKVTMPNLLKLIAAGAYEADAQRLMEQATLGEDPHAAKVLSDYLYEKGLSSLDDMRMVFWFDN